MTDAASQPADAPDAEVIALAGKLFDAARAGDSATLAAYVDAGAPADLTNDRGDTLLMLAAYHGHAATVAALLERGADPNRANDRGQTPLAGAVFKGAEDVLAVLLDGGADPGAAPRPPSTPPGCSARTSWSPGSRAADRRS